MKCSIGRMECCKRDAYDMGKHSRPTPRLPHIIFHLFTFYVFNLLSVRLSFTRVLACFRLFTNNYFEFTVLCWYTCLVLKCEQRRSSCAAFIGFSEHEPWIPRRFPAMFFPHWVFFLGDFFWPLFLQYFL